MTTKQLIQNFLEQLDQSGLPEDRKLYWAEKIGSGEFEEKDIKAFEEEMTEHIDFLEEDAEFLDFEKSQLEAERDERLKASADDIETLVQKAPEALEEDYKKFQNEILNAEDEANQQIEENRHSKESSEMDAIRKRLGNK